MAYAIMRTQKHSTGASLDGMTKHNKREIEVPNADEERNHLNQELIGTGNYKKDVNEAIEKSGAMYQKNSVKAIEHVMTASPEWWQKADKEDLKKFIEKSDKFLKEAYGKDSIIASSSLHMDEKTPHIHAFVVPIKKGKLKGGREVKRLAARRFIGTPEKLRNMQDLYAKHMKGLDLKRGVSKQKTKKQHQTVKHFYAQINNPVEKLGRLNTKEKKKGIINREQVYEVPKAELDRFVSNNEALLRKLEAYKRELSIQKSAASNWQSRAQKVRKEARKSLIRDVKKDFAKKGIKFGVDQNDNWTARKMTDQELKQQQQKSKGRGRGMG